MRERDERLYELYGKQLEEECSGKFLAIGPDGQTILDDDDGKVLQEAIERFGSGNFAFTRVGDRTLLFEDESPNLISEVETIVADPESWLNTPNDQLGGRSPIDLLMGTEQEKRRLRDLIRAVKHGMLP